MKNKESPPRKISPLKKGVFGILFFSFLLLVLEFLLGFADLEKYDSLFMPKSSFPIFVPGQGEMQNYYVTNPHFGNYINSQAFLQKKPEGLTRIFIVGGSAAYGFPYTEEYGFSGYLRRALDKSAPGRFEVINAAGMSYGSHRVLDVLKDVLLFDPDIVIVYSGNNEYVEQNVLQEVKAPSAAMKKISSLLDSTDTYRAIRLSLFKVAPQVFEKKIKNDLTDIRSNPQVSRGNIGRSPGTDAAIVANYRGNIAKMKQLLVQEDVKGIFCTVPVDIGGWIPDSGLPRFEDEDVARRWIDLIELRDAAFQRRDIAGESQYLQQILAITPHDPGMLFNYGKVLWMQGQYSIAYQELVKAKDYDYRPIRALSSFNEVIRGTAEPDNNIYLAELENRFKKKYLQGEAQGFFLDYCHLTENGHKLVAQWLLPKLDIALQTMQLEISLLDGLIRADPRAQIKTDFVKGHELYALALTAENNGRLEQAVEYYQQALAYLPEFDHIYTNLGHIYVDQGKMKDALAMYNKALQINPANHKVLLSLGYMSIRENDFAAAEEYFKKVLTITSDLPGAYGGLGEVAMQRNDFRQAIRYFNESLRLGQDSVWLRKNLAEAHLALGDREAAVESWKVALQFNPFDAKLKSKIEKYSR